MAFFAVLAVAISAVMYCVMALVDYWLLTLFKIEPVIDFFLIDSVNSL